MALRRLALAAALTWACGGESAPPGDADTSVDADLEPADTSRGFSPLPGPQPRLGPRLAFYDAPVPAPDLFASGRTDLSLFPREAGSFVDGLVALAATADGASLAGGVFFALTSPLPGDALPSLSAAFIDLDDGQRSPARLAYEADGGPHGAAHLLSAHPIQGLALLPGRRYALAVWLPAELRTSLGRPAWLAHLLSGRPIDGLADRPLWDLGVAAAADPEHLFALTVFTTQRATDDLFDFLAAARANPPTLSTPSLIEVHERFCVYEAALELPDFQHGPPPYANPGEGAWRRADGRPQLAGRAASRLFITAPRATSAAPTPYVVFIRTGGGGDRPLIDRGPRAVAGGPPIEATGSGPATHLAGAGWAALTWDGPHGGPSRNPSAQDEQFLMFNVLNLAGTRDSIRQTAIEAVLLRELAATLDLDTSDCPGAGPSLTFDPTRSAVMGHSMGGWIAPIALAASDTPGARGFAAAVLSGAGAGWMPNIVYKQSPLEVRPLAEALLGYSGIGRSLTMADPVLTLLQWAGEAADPQAYLHLARRDRNILMIEGFVDTYILPPISQGTSLGLRLDLAGPAMPYAEDPRLAGLEPLLDLLPLADLAHRNTPVTNNRDGYTAVVVHAPGDAIEDGHEAAFQTAGPKHQYRCFLETLARDGVPTVPSPSEDPWAACP